LTAIEVPTPRVRTGARFASIVIFAAQSFLIAAYVALIIVPFLVNDLHNEPESQVGGGWFDPKSLWPANTEPFGPLFTTVATLTWAFSYIFSGILTLAALITAATQWRKLQSPSRARLVGAVVLGTMFLWFLLGTDTGELISSWMAD
jgi:hypothetical protein